MAALVSAACGGGEAPSAGSSGTALKGVSSYFENRAPDYSSNGATCVFNIKTYYSETLSADAIESIAVYAPNQWRFTATGTQLTFGATSGKPYASSRFYYGNNPNAFPLAGTWKVELKLKNGEISSTNTTLQEPGSATAATHTYVYSKEDYTPSVQAQEYVPALARFPSTGYTVRYSSAGGGRLETTGLFAVRAAFLAAEPGAYNLECWLYDANKKYLGYTADEFSSIDHTASSLITVGGELAVVPALTVASSGSGTVDLSTVRYIRFVYSDGAQYTPSSYSRISYRSISALVPVY